MAIFIPNQWITDKQFPRLEKIAPGWGKMIRQGHFKKLRDATCCIVGTSHKFNSNYECHICNMMAADLYISRALGPVHFQSTLGRFLDHFEDKHPDLIKIPLVRT